VHPRVSSSVIAIAISRLQGYLLLIAISVAAAAIQVIACIPLAIRKPRCPVWYVIRHESVLHKMMQISV